MWQSDDIKDMAKELGLDNGSYDNEQDRFRNIAEQLGINDYNNLHDKDKLKNELKKRLNEKQANPTGNNGTNNFNKNFRKQKGSNKLADDINSNKSKAGRVRNAFNSIRQRRADAKKQEEIENENQEIDNQEKKSKAAQAVEKKKKQIIAKVAASLFTSQIFLGIFAMAVVILIIVFAIPLIISIISSQIENFIDDLTGSVTGVVGAVCSTNTDTIYPVTSTPLDRDTFISRVQSYNYNGKYKAQFQVFKDNAGMIYDIGEREGVNPEFCVIRAFIEGFSPVSQPGKTGDNNYWGINCTNGSSTCKSYESFQKGVEGFYSVIKSYDGYKNNNIYQVMGKYAYIGDKWYSPGDSSLGGCYYANEVIDQLKKLGFDERAEEVRYSCDNGTQIPTEMDTDQIAYAKWQVEQNIIPVRKNIFNLAEETSNACSKTTPLKNVDQLAEGNVSLTKIQSQTVSDLLKNNGSSIDEFNNNLLNIVKNDGIGTREAAVDISTYTVNTFASYGYAIPYLFYGGHFTTVVNEQSQAHNYPIDNYYGLNPYLGEKIYYNGSEGLTRTKADGSTVTYMALGLDCSGFVTWALHNAGVNMKVKTSGDYASLPNAGIHDANNTSEYIGKPGDVFAYNGHVALNIKYVSGSNPYYVVIEEAGHGLAVNKYVIGSKYIKKFKLVDMSYYYENEKTSNFEIAFKNGLINYQ